MTRLSLVMALVLLVLTPVCAWAWTATYSWAAVLGATSYKIEKSTDDGVTWVVVTTTLTIPSYVYVGLEPGLILFRVSACNANGCAPRANDGLWHNEAWQPPPRPGSLAVQ